MVGRLANCAQGRLARSTPFSLSPSKKFLDLNVCRLRIHNKKTNGSFKDWGILRKGQYTVPRLTGQVKTSAITTTVYRGADSLTKSTSRGPTDER